jgi:26S proteasome non-ATPase regulatory subunit 5
VSTCLSLVLGGSQGGEQLYRMLGQGVVESLVKDGKNSFDDIRLGAYACLHGMSMFEWGLRELAVCVQFSGFICDRFGDDTKGGAEFRFELIKRIVGSPGAEVIFGEDLKLFRKYIQEGAFYREVVVSVATESM